MQSHIFQLCHCPHATLGDGLDRLSKSSETGIADLIPRHVEHLALRQCPTGARLGQSRYASVANLVEAKREPGHRGVDRDCVCASGRAGVSDGIAVKLEEDHRGADCDEDSEDGNQLIIHYLPSTTPPLLSASAESDHNALKRWVLGLLKGMIVN